ncbi:unnamed protein product [Cyclocybe aegerita]|uniref:Ribonuclease H n=1 Tax=Cyclocybe aegerita TaxID=1973307 RepID=A0A8S0WSD7_CYCAE|nr:unnamed protein product [Cyclocybe aegerita]
MSKKSKGGFYAVRRGRVPGIYLTWPECEAQVKGFPDAKFKKFQQRGLAQDFVDGAEPAYKSEPSTSQHRVEEKGVEPVYVSQPSTSQHSIEEKEAESVYVSQPSMSQPDAKGKKRAFNEVDDETACNIVYADGACKGNGTTYCVAGVGVWWGFDDPRNIAERCPGVQTNNRAELIAILRVLETTLVSKRPLLIKTDSKYSIDCLQHWIDGWVANDWRDARGHPVKNASIIRCIAKHLEIRSRSGQKVSLLHVRGHSGDIGNEGADAMANQGVRLPAVPERDWESLLEELDHRLSQASLRNETNMVLVEILSAYSVVMPRTAEVPTKTQKLSHDPDPTPPSSPMSIASSQAMTDKAESASSTSTVIVPARGSVQAEAVNVDDYADCVLDDVDLAAELSEG